MLDQKKAEDHILYKGNHMTELEALKEIKAGANLSLFSTDADIPLRMSNGESKFTGVTKLMSFAAVTYHPDGYNEIRPEHWSKMLAKHAVKKNYHALSVIPQMFRMNCVDEFVAAGARLDRKNIKDWQNIFNNQEPDFIRACIHVNSSDIKFLTDENKSYATRKTGLKPDPVPKRRIPDFEENVKQDFIPILNIKSSADASSFLAAPLSEKTEERFRKLMDSDELLPPNFLKELLIPNRNAAFYHKFNDEARSEHWKKQILPYLSKDLCAELANKHAEAAISTQAFLSEEGVDALFKKVHGNAPLQKKYFCMMPVDKLKIAYLDGAQIDLQILQHAPALFAGTNYAYQYLVRHPYDILNLPGAYQTSGLLLKDGVKLNSRTVHNIEDHALREKVCLALNIVPKEKP
jgi:hypothetical protein